LISFDTLLDAVVAVFAEGLQVVPVPEQRRVPLVRLNVVNVFAGSPAEGTGRVQAKELSPKGLPLARIAALAAIGPLGIVATASGAYGLALASADHTSGNDLTAAAQAGWLGHGKGLMRGA
jgi:hypothetical protein